MSGDEGDVDTPLQQDIGNVSSARLLVAGFDIEHDGMTKSQAYHLYTSHFLSTWNVRTYEFAAIIFTAAAYPDTLIAASARGIARTLAQICFSSMVGRWVDRNHDRLKTLLTTIHVNRFAVIGASVLWFFIVEPGSEGFRVMPQGREPSRFPLSSILKDSAFALILLLGILEALSASGNMLSMERDWIVTAASPEGKVYDLTHLNAVMRRIDLSCKLIAPVLFSVIVSAAGTKVGVLVVAGMSTASWAIEMWCARRVWNHNSKLKSPKTMETPSPSDDYIHHVGNRGLRQKLFESLWRYSRDYKNYFSSTVWIPSLALAFLHISALAYSATFITFLLNVGFPLDLITLARAAGSLVEISSTIVTPVGVQYLGRARHHSQFRNEDRLVEDSTRSLLEGSLEETLDQESKTETGLERLGLWGISWQLLNLVPVVLALWSLAPSSTPSSLIHLFTRILGPVLSQPLLAFILFFFLSISRLGLWVYDLTTQQLTQTMTAPAKRSSFTGVEYSFISFFELGHFIISIILHRPDQFKWIALMSWAAVAISTLAYSGWVWKMRGHLVHWDRIGKGCECAKIRVGH